MRNFSVCDDHCGILCLDTRLTEAMVWMSEAAANLWSLESCCEDELYHYVAACLTDISPVTPEFLNFLISCVNSWYLKYLKLFLLHALKLDYTSKLAFIWFVSTSPAPASTDLLIFCISVTLDFYYYIFVLQCHAFSICRVVSCLKIHFFPNTI